MMFRFLLFAVLAFVLWRLLWSGMKGMLEGMGYQPPGGKGQSVGLVRDPVCGTFVLPSRALTSGTGAGTRYFCSEKCRADYGHSHRRNTEETQKEHGHSGNTEATQTNYGHSRNTEETQKKYGE